MPNEDYASVAQNSQIAVIAVSDGAGAMENGGIAAKLVSNALQNDLFLNFQEYYFSDSDTARRKITVLVNQLLTNYSKENDVNPTSLACTIMVAAMDTEGRCVCFHLGDGIILRQKKHQPPWDVVSSPRNGIQCNTTYLTMNCNMWSNLQFYRWKDSEQESLLLLTDGASNHLTYRNGPNGWKFASNNCDTSIQSMKTFLYEQKPEDDYTCGLISLK